MTSTIVNYIIDKFLSNILEIDPAKTNASLWSGTVSLSDLKFKRSIFTSLNIPYLELVDGYIDSLNISMSLPRFYLYPINVKINKVFFFAKMKDINKIDKEKEIENMQNYKEGKLIKMEELMSELNVLQKENNGDTKSLLDNILSNLHLEINDIVIKFDDNVSTTKSKLISYGLLMKELSIENIDDNRKHTQLSNLSVYLDYNNNTITSTTDKELSFKENCIQELQNYLNENNNNNLSHNYLLYNFQLEFDLVQDNKDVLGIEILFPNTITFGLDIKQIKHICKELNYIKLKTLYSDALEAEFYSKTLTENEQKEYIDLYAEYYKTKYIPIYQDVNESQKYKEQLKQIEINLNYNQIQSMRYLSKDKIDYMLSIKGIDDQIETLENKWLITKASRDAQIEQLKKEKEAIESKRKEQLESKTHTGKFIGNKSTYMITLFIKEVVFELKNKTNKMISFLLNGLDSKITLTQANENTKLELMLLTLNDISIEQYIINACDKYKNILSTQKSTSVTDNRNKLFYLNYQNTSKQKLPSLEIEANKQMHIVLNLYILQFISNKVISSLKGFDLSSISAYTTGEIKKYIKQGYAYISNNDENGIPFLIDLHVSMECPVILYPLSLIDNESKCLLIQLGKVNLVSEEANNQMKYILNTSEFTFDFICGKEESKRLIDNFKIGINIQNENGVYSIGIIMDKMGMNICDMDLKFVIELLNVIKEDSAKIEQMEKKKVKENGIQKQNILANNNNEQIKRSLTNLDKIEEQNINVNNNNDNKNQTIMKEKPLLHLTLMLKEFSICLEDKSNKPFILFASTSFNFGISVSNINNINVHLSINNISLIHPKTSPLKIIETSHGEGNDFLVLSLNLTPNTNTTNVDVKLKTFSLVIDISFISAMYAFMLHYLSIWKDSQKQKPPEQIDTTLIDSLINFEETTHKGLSHKAKLKEELKRRMTYSVKQQQHPQTSTKALEGDILKDLKKIKNENKIIFELNIENINILLSDNTSDKLKNDTFKISSGISLNYNSEDIYYDIYDKYDNVVFIEYNKQDQFINFNLEHLKIALLNNNTNTTNNMVNNHTSLINDISFYIKIANSLDLKTKYTNTLITIELSVKELILHINLYFINYVNNLITSINQNIASITPQQTQPINNNQNINIEPTLVNNIPQIPDKLIIKSNIDLFEHKNQILFSLNSFKFELTEIINHNIYHLFTITCNSISLTMCSNSNTSNCHNLSLGLIESATQKPYPVSSFKVDDLYNYIHLTISNINIKCINLKLNEWDSLIEPFHCEFTYIHIIKRMRARIDIKIKNMFNINITPNVFKVINKMKYLYNNNYNQTGNNSVASSSSVVSYEHKEKGEIVKIVNKSGVKWNMVTEKGETISLLENDTKDYYLLDNSNNNNSFYVSFKNDDIFKEFNNDSNNKYDIKRKKHSHTFNISKTSKTILYVHSSINSENMLQTIVLSSGFSINNSTDFNFKLYTSQNTSLEIPTNTQIDLPITTNNNKSNIYIELNNIKSKIDFTLNNQILSFNQKAIKVIINNTNGICKVELLPVITLSNYTPYIVSVINDNDTNNNNNGVHIKQFKKEKLYIPLKNNSLNELIPQLIKNKLSIIINRNNNTQQEVYTLQKEYTEHTELNEHNKCYNITFKSLTFSSTLNLNIIITNTSISNIELIITFKYSITNRTPYPLDICKSISVNHNKNVLLSDIPNIKNFSFKTIESERSKEFTVIPNSPLEQSFLLKSKSQIGHKEQYYAPISLIINTSSLFPYTTFIIFEPRYIICNDLPFDIFYKHKQNNIVKPLSKNEEKIITLSNTKDLQHTNMISLCFDSNKWIDDINIDNIGMFDIKKYNNKIIRCIIHSIDKGCIYIMLTLVDNPLIKIENRINDSIKLINKNKESIIIKPNESYDLINKNNIKQWTIISNKHSINKEIDFDIDDVITINNISLRTSNMSNVIGRVLTIVPFTSRNKSINAISQNNKKVYELYMDCFRKRSGMKVTINMTNGIGLSLIDDTPYELMYVSLYHVYLSYSNKSINNEYINISETNEEIILKIKNIQIDSHNRKSIISPRQQLLPQTISAIPENERIPFAQIALQRNRNINIKDNTILNCTYPLIDFILQPIIVNIDNDFIKDISTLISIYQPEIVNDNEVNINDILTRCEFFNAFCETPRKVIIEQTQIYNTSIYNVRYFSIAAIKIFLTVNININKLQLSNMPSFISTILSSLTSVSDIKLKYTELLFTNINNDINHISSILISHYKQQTIAQCYKILFGIDLIGNPINLFNSICRGCFQLVNEPRKGFIEGKGIKGIEKGITSFVSNVVGGSMDSINKATGSLLEMTKKIQQQQQPQQQQDKKEEKKPKGFFGGTWSGLKKGAMDVGSGITGIFTKPIEGAKEGGIGGFFKGVGSGVVGAALTPVSAVLTIGNEVSAGAASIAKRTDSSNIANQKRYLFRKERVMNVNEAVKEYDYYEREFRKTMLGEFKFNVKGEERTVLINERMIMWMNRTNVEEQINIEDIEKFSYQKLKGMECIVFVMKNNRGKDKVMIVEGKGMAEKIEGIINKQIKEIKNNKQEK